MVTRATAVANQKEDVGKTTTAATLRHGPVLRGKHVLLVGLRSPGPGGKRARERFPVLLQSIRRPRLRRAQEGHQDGARDEAQGGAGAGPGAGGRAGRIAASRRRSRGPGSA